MNIFLSYSRKNIKEADLIYDKLTHTHKLQITRDVINLATYESLSYFMESVREHDYVIKLISEEYLRSKACMKELLHFIKDDTQKSHYANRTLPIITNNQKDEVVNIFTPDGQLEIIEFWLNQKKGLEDKINIIKKNHPDSDIAVQPQIKELKILMDISENIGNYL